jgi:hypothetical protein
MNSSDWSCLIYIRTCMTNREKLLILNADTLPA